MHQPPPTSTLFPYTTLFRSNINLDTSDVLIAKEIAKRVRFSSGGLPCVKAMGVLQFPSDRKSTRLNSSHVSISYAVFCLKKKKNIKQNADVVISVHTSSSIIPFNHLDMTPRTVRAIPT